jgi:hypothetical protein
MDDNILGIIKDLNGIIYRWPKRKEEKMAVLKYMQSKFEKNKIYTEREVNEIIRKWHSFGDFALIRREMYDNYLMDRTPDCKKYWIQK